MRFILTLTLLDLAALPLVGAIVLFAYAGWVWLVG
jgi:hypothetical protein